VLTEAFATIFYCRQELIFFLIASYFLESLKKPSIVPPRAGASLGAALALIPAQQTKPISSRNSSSPDHTMCFLVSFVMDVAVGALSFGSYHYL